MGRAADSTLIRNDQPSSCSSSSSIDSSNHPPSAALADTPSSSSSLCHVNDCRTCKPDFNIDLRLGLSSSQREPPSFAKSRGQRPVEYWPPIKSILRSSLEERALHERPSLFVKVYMEGIPIGRKLNLLAYNSYDGIIKALCQMFRIIILCPNDDARELYDGQNHVLTFQDEEGDWMMVGDIPWEMFVGSTVKRLKITRATCCVASLHNNDRDPRIWQSGSRLIATAGADSRKFSDSYTFYRRYLSCDEKKDY